MECHQSVYNIHNCTIHPNKLHIFKRLHSYHRAEQCRYSLWKIRIIALGWYITIAFWAFHLLVYIMWFPFIQSLAKLFFYLSQSWCDHKILFLLLRFVFYCFILCIFCYPFYSLYYNMIWLVIFFFQKQKLKINFLLIRTQQFYWIERINSRHYCYNSIRFQNKQKSTQTQLNDSIWMSNYPRAAKEVESQ